MKPFRTMFFFLLVFLLAGCSFLPVPELQPAATNNETTLAEPSPAPLSSGTALPENNNPETMADNTAPSPPAAESRWLYFLSEDALWRILPGTGQPERITTPDIPVHAFAVWPGDGRLAIASKSGQLFAVIPGEQPDLLFDLAGRSTFPAFITGLDWSPAGESLAFTVNFDGQGQLVFNDYPSPPSGLWMVNIHDRQPTWLKSSHFMKSLQANASALEVLAEPLWSPDGLAILVTGYYWEWKNMNWVYPLEYAEDDRNIHTVSHSAEGDFESWMSASWTPDNTGLLLSGKTYTAYSDLIRVDRQTVETETIIDGDLANLYIFEAREVPPETYLPGKVDGIHSGSGRLLFMGGCPMCEGDQSARLYVVAPGNGSLLGEAIGPENLCTVIDDFGHSNYPRHIEWSPDFAAGVLICSSKEIYLVDMRQESPQLIDLLSSLPALTEGEILTFKWGEN